MLLCTFVHWHLHPKGPAKLLAQIFNSRTLHLDMFIHLAILPCTQGGSDISASVSWMCGALTLNTTQHLPSALAHA
jgi:hypothetical protein